MTAAHMWAAAQMEAGTETPMAVEAVQVQAAVQSLAVAVEIEADTLVEIQAAAYSKESKAAA